jgi:tetratricopeptide (TPR) repeat protein
VTLGTLEWARGDARRAIILFTEALTLSPESYLQYYERKTLVGIGRAELDLGDIQSARRHFQEALVKWPWEDYLEPLGLLAISEQQMERAARLLGATENWHNKTHYSRILREREERKKAISFVQQTLGEEAFTKAWEEGKAMTLEQAIIYAKVELPG